MIANPETAPNARSVPEIGEIQELSIAIGAKNLNPSLLTVDFLKYSGIVPADWELKSQPVSNPNFAQVNFQNGVNIVAQPRTITFVELINTPDSPVVNLPEIARAFVEKLPLAEYQSLAIGPKSIIPFPGGPAAVHDYIAKTLLSPGPWQEFGTAPVQVGLNFLYQLESRQFALGINEARIQIPDGRSIPAILFSGNFTYNLAEGGDRLTILQQFLGEWRADLQIFREVVRERFLAGRVTSVALDIPVGPPGGL
jgi:hypothetical protein